ncbi:MAG: hypothetical protein JWR50_3176 [Mucilaginibacter sp.]|nr:hypothetical protein [Mucilaginibacter sp.]
MKKITLKDLKEQGFELNKNEAMELQHHISHIAQRGADEPTEVFAPALVEEQPDDSKLLTIESRKEYLAAEDFVYDEERKIFIDDLGIVVTLEQVEEHDEEHLEGSENDYTSSDSELKIEKPKIVKAAAGKPGRKKKADPEQ